jgi:hypothetical protein
MENIEENSSKASLYLSHTQTQGNPFTEAQRKKKKKKKGTKKKTAETKFIFLSKCERDRPQSYI